MACLTTSSNWKSFFLWTIDSIWCFPLLFFLSNYDISSLFPFLKICCVKVLWINNSNPDLAYPIDGYKIVFSTPSLGFLTINNVHHGHQLPSTCNLSSLEVDINVSVSPCSPFFKSLLQVLANVNKLTLSWRTLRMMLFLSFTLYVFSFSVCVWKYFFFLYDFKLIIYSNKVLKVIFLFLA